VVLGPDRRLRVRLAADYGRLDFLRVLRSRPAERIESTGALLRPVAEDGRPLDPATGLPEAAPPPGAPGGAAPPRRGGAP
jgi:rod shape-determining protein MreC